MSATTGEPVTLNRWVMLELWLAARLMTIDELQLKMGVDREAVERAIADLEEHGQVFRNPNNEEQMQLIVKWLQIIDIVHSDARASRPETHKRVNVLDLDKLKADHPEWVFPEGGSDEYILS
jgi:DNA-binding MarR family transcriptional regulator